MRCLLIAVSALPSAERDISVLNPKDMQVIYEKELTLILVVPKQQYETVHIVINEHLFVTEKVALSPLFNDRQVLVRKRIPLTKRGVSTIKLILTPQNGNAEAQVVERSIYATLLPAILSQTGTIPNAYQGKRFHNEANESQVQAFFHHPRQTLHYCYNCHSKMKLYSHRHGPAGYQGPRGTSDNGCFLCHNPNSTPTSYRPLESFSQLCFKCHIEFYEKIFKRPINRHGPTNTRQCQACHNPHGANANRHFLILKTNSLCLACHNSFDPDYYIGGHPTTGRTENPAELPSGPFSSPPLRCTSCHSPHGSNSPKFFPHELEGNTITGICQYCHNK